ncbi:hypothetical protein AC249_AIPGENE19910 [Exaiptasia diaphana]|nr:hypothetical protein AC249_AIPGENE19910 [Exaiptasia diaphana]
MLNRAIEPNKNAMDIYKAAVENIGDEFNSEEVSFDLDPPRTFADYAVQPKDCGRPDIDPTSTPHRPDIDPTSTPHRPHIDPTSTLHRHDIDMTSTRHRHNIDMTST